MSSEPAGKKRVKHAWSAGTAGAALGAPWLRVWDREAKSDFHKYAQALQKHVYAASREGVSLEFGEGPSSDGDGLELRVTLHVSTHGGVEAHTATVSAGGLYTPPADVRASVSHADNAQALLLAALALSRFAAVAHGPYRADADRSDTMPEAGCTFTFDGRRGFVAPALKLFAAHVPPGITPDASGERGPHAYVSPTNAVFEAAQHPLFGSARVLMSDRVSDEATWTSSLDADFSPLAFCPAPKSIGARLLSLFR